MTNVLRICRPVAGACGSPYGLADLTQETLNQAIDRLKPGNEGHLPVRPHLRSHILAAKPAGSELCVSAIGPQQLPATTHALLLGGHLRVGLEDNLYLRRGEKATNAALVARAARIVREPGMEPATPAEARDILGLKPLGS